MEVKVYVDGVPRVVCGVTDNTTCQEVVIALAQALSRPGRYTLQEKFKDFERCVGPGERLLEALQKYGEHGKEVQLTLLLSHRLPPLPWDPAPGARPRDPPGPQDPPAPPLRRRRPDPGARTRRGSGPVAGAAHRQSLPVLSRLRREEEEEGPPEEVKRPKRKSLTLTDAWGWLGSLGRGRLHYCVRSDPEGTRAAGGREVAAGTGTLPEGSAGAVPAASGSVGSKEASGQEGFLSRVRRRKRERQQSRERRASCCGSAAESGPDGARSRKSFPGAKDQDLGAKDQDLTVKDQDLGAKDQDLTVKDQDLGAKDQDLGAKDQDLTVKDQDLGAKDQDLGAKDQDLTVKDQDLTVKDQDLTVKDQTLGAKDQTLGAKDGAPGRASGVEEEKLKLRERITSQGSRLRDLDHRLSSVDRQIRSLEGLRTERPAPLDGRRSAAAEQEEREEREEREELRFWEQELQAELGFEGDIQTQFLELREKARRCKAELEEYRRRMQRLALTAGATPPPPVQQRAGAKEEEEEKEKEEDRGILGKGVTEISLGVETSEAAGGGDTGRKETPSRPHAPLPPEQIKERRLTGPTELREWWSRWSETRSQSKAAAAAAAAPMCKAAEPAAPVHRSELTIYLGSAKV